MKSLLIIVCSLAACFYYTDLESESGFRAVFLPLMDIVLLCALAVWLVGRGAGRSASYTDGSIIADLSSHSDSCGGGDGGGGGE